MPKLTIDKFFGEVPQQDPTLLPRGYATRALNCNLESQALSCFRGGAEVHAGGDAAASAYWTGGSWRILESPSNIIDAPVSNNRKYAGRYAPLGGTALTVPSLLTFDDATPANDTSLPLALPAPDVAPTSVTVTTSDRTTDSNNLPDPPLQQSLAVYTFVTTLGEESRPSPVSDVFERQPGTDDMTIVLPALPTAASDRGVDRYRVYVSETIFGQTQFQLLAETTGTPTSVTIPGNAPSEGLLESLSYDDLPNEYRGFVTMPNGIIVAHRGAANPGKEIRFSDPYRIQAWPLSYERLVDDNIVGLAMFGQTLCILTTGRPFLATGLTPETIVLRKVDIQAPCLTRTSIVDLGYSAAYASPRGLVRISNEDVQVITANLLSQSQWRALTPQMQASEWDGRYIWSYLPAGGAARTTIMLDLTGEQPYLQRLDVDARAWIYRPDEAHAYYISEADGKLYRFDDAATDYAPFDWTSGESLTSTEIGYGVALVQGKTLGAQAGDFTFEVIADGQVVGTGTELNVPFRIKMGRYRSWSVRLRGVGKVTSVTLAGGVEELGV